MILVKFIQLILFEFRSNWFNSFCNAYIYKFITITLTLWSTVSQYITQVSLILRGANDYMLDEMERALHDALSIVKRTLESNTVNFGIF